MFNQAKLVKEILSQFKINKRGVHGPSHWARVKHHGLIIGEQVGADLEVIKLFAFLHDSQRLSEYRDPEHGLRAAQYAKSLNGKFFDLNTDQMDLLTTAMEGHSEGDLGKREKIRNHANQNGTDYSSNSNWRSKQTPESS
jgi:uncharacterized protein